MWKLLNTQYRLRITQETTRVVLKCIDPAGVALRSRHCLQRRKYGSQGPIVSLSMWMGMTNLNHSG